MVWVPVSTPRIISGILIIPNPWSIHIVNSNRIFKTANVLLKLLNMVTSPFYVTSGGLLGTICPLYLETI